MPEQDELDRIILVYDADSGIAALLQDILKKAIGREDCALCEIIYSPLGKRAAWRQCAVRLDIVTEELHRDQMPEVWGVASTQVPCILGRRGDSVPFVLVPKCEIELCHGSVPALEARIRVALETRASMRARQNRNVSA